jgi:molybdopterin-guanine dinucleotide biosynthesis protein MobB
MTDLQGDPEPPIGELIGKMLPVDFVLVEGLREPAYDCIEVRRGVVHATAYPHPRLIAIAIDAPDATSEAPILDLNSPSLICDFFLKSSGFASGKPDLR